MKKKILIVFDYLELGGGTRSIINIVKALANEYDIFFLTGILPDSWTKYSLNELQPLCKKIISFPVSHERSDFILTVRIFFQVIKNIKSLKDISFDFVLLNLTRSSFPLLLFNLLKSRTICIFHGSIYFERNSQFTRDQKIKWNILSKIRFELLNILFKFMQDVVLKKVDKIICFSKYSKDILTQNFNIEKNKVEIVHPPIFVKNNSKFLYRKKYLIDTNTFVISIASRIEPRKGIHLAMEAAYEVLQKFKKKNVVFYFLGPTYHLNYFYSIFMKLGELDLTGKVIFLGPMKHEKAAEFLAASDLLLMPSIEHETLGLVTLESLLQGVPVIGFNSGATPEIISQVDQRFVSSTLNKDGIAKSILWYLHLNRSERKKLEKKAQKLIQKSYSDQNFLKYLNRL